MNKFFAAFFALIFAASCAAPAKTQVLRVGMELAYPPFETKDDAGNPTGISADIAKAFGEYLGREVVIENTAWSGLIPALKTDKLDMVISSMTINDERKETVDFSEPYASAYLALLAGPKSTVQTAADVDKAGRILALKQGTSAHLYAQEFFKNATVNTFSSETAAMTEVIQGKADGFIYDQLTIYRNSLDNPGSRMVALPTQTPQYWGAAFKKGNTELVSQFNAFLIKFKQDGGFDKLTQKYLAEEKKVFDEKGFNFFF